MFLKNVSSFTLGLSLLISLSAHSQINLGQFQSHSVKEWASVGTTIDSLLVSTKVNSGTAVTRITMSVAPTRGCPHGSASDDPQLLDSLEMTLNFSLPSDFVADSLWLWVDGKPQEAYIQDKRLAMVQYQQIVGGRLNQALLQYDGNGSYFLRIFPASSNVSRKIAIQFHHTFDDNAASINEIVALLPIVFNTTRMNYLCKTFTPKPKLGYMQLICEAKDTRSYVVDMPGIGTGTFSMSKPFFQAQSDIYMLDKGTIITRDPSGDQNEFHWVGRDLKSDKYTAGFSMPLSDKKLNYLPEPSTRIIVLDIRNGLWNWNDYYAQKAALEGNSHTPNPEYTTVNIWKRAQKYAILAVQQYVKSNQSFNVVIAGKMVQSVFGQPVSGGTANKQKAIAAILDAKPDTSANTIEALRSAIAQASEGIVVCISDFHIPALYYENVYSGEVSAQGKRYDSILEQIDSMFASVPALTIFPICDNWQLSKTAIKSGGYCIGGLRNRFGIPYTDSVADGKKVTILQMFPFFGSSNPTGLCGVKITSDNLDDIVFSLEANEIQDSSSYSFTPIRPYTDFYALANPLLRVAGRTDISNFRKSMKILVSGKMSGLRFTKEITMSTDYLPIFSAYNPGNDVQWAFRKSIWLASIDWTANAGAIKQIGKEYHIVTDQTCLLALEPGMTLWNDTAYLITPAIWDGWNKSIIYPFPNPPANPISLMLNASLVIDRAPHSNSTYGGGFDIDNISLSDITKVGVLPIVKNSKSGAGLVATVVGKKIVVRFPENLKSSVNLSLYDLSGRRCAFQIIDAARLTSLRFVWDLAAEKGAPVSGNYILRITAQGLDHTCKLPSFVR